MHKLKAKLFFLAAITIFALATLFLALFNYNPFLADYSIFVFFYLSILVTLAGILTFMTLFIKFRFSPRHLANEDFWPSVRQGLLMSLMVSALLLLQGLKILDFWIGVPLSIAIILLELFFHGNKFKKN